MLKATLDFPSLQMAKAFASHWTSKTLTGHDMTAVRDDGSVGVTVYDIDDDKKAIIETYVTSINE